MYQTHEEQLNHVLHSIPGRDNPRIPISGMNGIPADALLERYGRMYIEESDDVNQSEIARRVHELGGNLEKLVNSLREELNKDKEKEKEKDMLQSDNHGQD